jgi:hypothetical protein
MVWCVMRRVVCVRGRACSPNRRIPPMQIQLTPVSDVEDGVVDPTLGGINQVGHADVVGHAKIAEDGVLLRRVAGRDGGDLERLAPEAGRAAADLVVDGGARSGGEGGHEALVEVADAGVGEGGGVGGGEGLVVEGPRDLAVGVSAHKVDGELSELAGVGDVDLLDGGGGAHRGGTDADAVGERVAVVDLGLVVLVAVPGPDGRGGVQDLELAVAPGGLADGGPRGLRVDPGGVEGRTAVADVHVDDALVLGDDLVVGDGVGALVAVHVAGEDGVDLGGEEDGLHRLAHHLAVALVGAVGVVPGGVDDDEEPRGDGAVDLGEVGVEELDEGGRRAEAAGVEGAQRDDVRRARVVAEVPDVVGAADGVRHPREAGARRDGDGALGHVIRLVVADVDGEGAHGRNGHHHALEGVPVGAAGGLAPGGCGGGEEERGVG